LVVVGLVEEERFLGGDEREDVDEGGRLRDARDGRVGAIGGEESGVGEGEEAGVCWY
jgi:hypothetical protein